MAALLGVCREDRISGHGHSRGGEPLSLALQAIHGAEWRYNVRSNVYEGSDEIAMLISEDMPRPVTWAEWLERVHPQDLGYFLGQPDQEGTAEFRFRAIDGQMRWARCSRAALTDETGVIETVLGIMVDITEERVREAAWAELATHDPLTGLLNRRGLRQEIDGLLAASRPMPCLALFGVDLDQFKETNDAHGHAAGDAVLVEAARRLAAAAEGAICARLGGDEFVAVLPVPGEVEAQEARARLQSAFHRPLAFRGRWLPVSASVGVACRPITIDIARLGDDADADLYARKRARSRFQVAAA